MNGNESGAPACSGCHGPDGQGSPDAGFPRLAGLPSGYLGRALAGFADGSRENEIMTPVARALSPDERAAVAAYYAALRPAKAEGGEPPDERLVARGAALATVGDWGNGLPGCGQCHGPAGEGVGTAFPPLAGQPSAYLSAQLTAWREGRRRNDPLGLMTGVSGKLSDGDIAAVAAYYASLPVPAVKERMQ